MKASNIIKDRGEEMRILWCKLSTQLSSSIVLLEGELGLIVNVYCKLLRNDLKIKKKKYNWYTNGGEKMNSFEMLN